MYRIIMFIYKRPRLQLVLALAGTAAVTTTLAVLSSSGAVPVPDPLSPQTATNLAGTRSQEAEREAARPMSPCMPPSNDADADAGEGREDPYVRKYGKNLRPDAVRHDVPVTYDGTTKTPPSGYAPTRHEVSLKGPDVATTAAVKASNPDCATAIVNGGVYAPSDGDFAVSANYFVSTTNNHLDYGPKGSAPTSSWAPIDFFHRVWPDYPGTFTGSNGLIYPTGFMDPHVQWTPAGGGNGRFAMEFTTNLTCAGATGGACTMIAITKSESPSVTSDWWYTRYDNPGDKWDLAVTSDKLVVRNQTGNGPVWDLFPTASMISGAFGQGATLPLTASSNHQQITGANVPRGMSAEPSGTAAGGQAQYYYAYALGTNLVYHTITGSVGSATLSSQISMGSETALGNGYTEPPVPGGAMQSYVMNEVAHAVWYRNATAHNIIAFSGNYVCGDQTSHVCGFGHKYDTTTPNLVTHYYDIAGGDVLYPALAADSGGGRVVTYTYSNPSQLPEAAIMGDGYNTLVAGADSTAFTPAGQRVRWGDYFGAAMDPSAPTYVYGMATAVSAPGGDGNVGAFNWKAAYGRGTAAAAG